MDKEGEVNIDIEKWLERINTCLDVQKDTGSEIITMRFTRRELIELRLVIATLEDKMEEEHD